MPVPGAGVVVDGVLGEVVLPPAEGDAGTDAEADVEVICFVEPQPTVTISASRATGGRER